MTYQVPTASLRQIVKEKFSINSFSPTRMTRKSPTLTTFVARIPKGKVTLTNGNLVDPESPFLYRRRATVSGTSRKPLFSGKQTTPVAHCPVCCRTSEKKPEEDAFCDDCQDFRGMQNCEWEDNGSIDDGFDPSPLPPFCSFRVPQTPSNPNFTLNDSVSAKEGGKSDEFKDEAGEYEMSTSPDSSPLTSLASDCEPSTNPATDFDRSPQKDQDTEDDLRLLKQLLSLFPHQTLKICSDKAVFDSLRYSSKARTRLSIKRPLRTDSTEDFARKVQRVLETSRN